MFNREGRDDNKYNIENIEFISKTSPKVADLIEKEYNRQKNNIELIASVLRRFWLHVDVVCPGSMRKGILM